MSTIPRHAAPWFAAGIALGGAVFSVAYFAAGAIRRRRAPESDRIVIDGARPLDPAARAARPMPENPRRPLASEVEDYSPTSQRW